MDQLQIQKLRQQFLLYDERGDGKIGLMQLGECLRYVGTNPTEARISRYIKQLQERYIERVSFDEFLPIYRSEVAADCPKVDHLISGLSYFDEKNTGYIKAARLRHILQKCGERLTKKELDILLAGRVNDQGLVNYVELVHFITNS